MANYNCKASELIALVEKIIEERKAQAPEDAPWRYSEWIKLSIQGRILPCAWYKDHLTTCGGINTKDIITLEDVYSQEVQGLFTQDGYHRLTCKVYKFPQLWEDKFFYKEEFDNQNGHQVEWGFAYTPNRDENYITLTEGTYLMNKFGKYMPNLAFINNEPIIFWERCTSKKFNISEEAELSYIEGDYFISKKGTKCFRIKDGGNHVLVRDAWGGAFSRYRGGSLPEEDAIYYRRASSNGGGSGYDYAIYPKGWKHEVSEEDI